MGFRRQSEHLEPTKVPTNIDVAWAAGIWEGEGSISTHNKRRATVIVTQKDPEILYRLRDWFGGNVHPKQGKNQTCSIWQACGDRGRFFIALIYPFLSGRRRVQVDTSEVLSYLHGADVSQLSYEEIWSALDSRPARKRRSDAFNETRAEQRKRLADNARRFYWNNRPKVLAVQNVRRATKRAEQKIEEGRVM